MKVLWALVVLLSFVCVVLAVSLYKITNPLTSEVLHNESGPDLILSPLPGTQIDAIEDEVDSYIPDSSAMQLSDPSELPGGISGSVAAPVFLDMAGASDSGSLQLIPNSPALGDGVVEKVGDLSIVDFQKAKAPPETLPFLTRGCEGECCGILNSNTLKKEIAFRKAPDSNSEIIKTLPKGFELRNPIFYLKVKEYGESEVIMYDGARKKVKGIFYLGGGNIFVWDGLKFSSLDEFRGVENGLSESWLRANDDANNSGWILLDGGPGDILELGWCR